MACWYGKNIKVRSDPWIPTLQGFSPELVLRSMGSIQVVADLMIPGEGKWNEDLVKDIFDPLTASHILNTEIHNDAC